MELRLLPVALLEIFRYLISSFTSQENAEAARNLLLKKLRGVVSADTDDQAPVPSPKEEPAPEDETWDQMVKRRKTERQEQGIITELLNLQLILLLNSCKVRRRVGVVASSVLEELVNGFVYGNLEDTACVR